MNVTKCSGCPASIVWLMTTNGARMCMNASFFTSDELRAPAPVYNAADHQEGVHWATCPNAKHFKRGKR